MRADGYYSLGFWIGIFSGLAMALVMHIVFVEFGWHGDATKTVRTSIVADEFSVLTNRVNELYELHEATSNALCKHAGWERLPSVWERVTE